MIRIKTTFLLLAVVVSGLSACATAHQQNFKANNINTANEAISDLTATQTPTPNRETNAKSQKTSGKAEQKTQAKSVFPEKERDLQIEKTILKSYKPSSADDMYYHYDKIDLNDDGILDALVFISGSNCGTGGCELDIFKGTKNGYEEMRSYLTRTPIIIDNKKTNGWKDLKILLVGGGITKGYYVRLQFDGKNYPEDEFDLPALKTKETGGIAYLDGIEDYYAGFSLK